MEKELKKRLAVMDKIFEALERWPEEYKDDHITLTVDEMHQIGELYRRDGYIKAVNYLSKRHEKEQKGIL